MAKTGNTGLTRIIKAAGYSKQGLQAAWANEASFRQEALLALIYIYIACAHSSCLGDYCFVIKR